MKKAYVKPVFLAEEFVAAMDHVAACTTNYWTPQIIQWPTNGQPGTDLCEGNDGHSVGFNENQALILSNHDKEKFYYDYSQKITYKEYAEWNADQRPGANADDYTATNAYLFNSGHSACDFVWDNTNSDVGVWKKGTDGNWIVSLIDNFGTFFLGASANGSGHRPAINGTVVPS